MHNIRWDLLPGVISQVLINIAIFTLVLTIFGAGILKYFVRIVPSKPKCQDGVHARIARAPSHSLCTK
jgi:hypothetical protein